MVAKFSSDAIRNICLLGHGGDGKTSIAEAMLYLAKATDRLGKIADGNTVCDFDPEEIKRGFSLSASLAHFEWKGKKINLLDTPGYFDFAGEVQQAVAAAGVVGAEDAAGHGLLPGCRHGGCGLMDGTAGPEDGKIVQLDHRIAPLSGNQSVGHRRPVQ